MKAELETELARRAVAPKVGDKLLVHGAEKDHIGGLTEIRVTDGKTRYGVQWKDTLGLAWGFAEHEVIEARSAYATAHSQPSKLDTMKAMMTEYDRATKVYEELPPGFWDAKATGEVIRARNRLVSSAPDYLRTLLAVAEAAQEIGKFGFDEYDIFGHGDGDEWGAAQKRFYDALKAIE